MNNTLVSIIIPTYNRSYIIGETLDSIIAQTYTNWECIIVDDGSTDNTIELITKYISKDKRFQFYHRPKDRIKGANACRNYGFEISKGDYIKWFDSDDIMHPEFLYKQMLVLQQNPEVDFCACYALKFQNTVDDLSEAFYPEIINNENSIYNFILGKLFFLTPSSLWRRKTLENKLLFDENLYNAHETEFNFRRLIEGCKFYYLEEILFYVRRGHDSIDFNAANFQSQLSIFKYFKRAYQITSKLNFPYQERAVKYLIYRNLVQIYSIISTQSFFNRLKYLGLIKDVISFSKFLDFKTIMKIYIGFFGAILFKKGYFLLYLKQFDYRKNVFFQIED